MPAPGSRPPPLLLALLLAFTAFLALLLAQSLAPKRVATFTPSHPGPDGRWHRSAPDAADTVTVDARDEDAWRFVDLDRGALLAPPDTAGWDLAIRRFRIIVGDAVADLGPVAFDAVAVAPERGYVPTRFANDTTNPAIEHWYRYGFLSHVLRPGGRVYVVRTDAGSYAKLEILSYYCPGPVAGCLTFRYAPLPAGAGRPR
jgi:hypothetical protein